MKRFAFLFFIVGLVLFGCNKDQRAVRALSETDWLVKSVENVDGSPALADYSAWFGEVTFEECKQKKAPCQGTLTYVTEVSFDFSDGSTQVDRVTTTVYFDYTIFDKGEGLDLVFTGNDVLTEILEDGQVTFSTATSNACGSQATQICARNGSVNEDVTEVQLVLYDGTVWSLSSP